MGKEKQAKVKKFEDSRKTETKLTKNSVIYQEKRTEVG